MALADLTLSCGGSQQRWTLDPAEDVVQLMARLQLGSQLAAKGGFRFRLAGEVPAGLPLPRSKQAMRGPVGNVSAKQLLRRRDAAGKLQLLVPVIDSCVCLAASDPASLLAGQSIEVTELPSPFVTLKTLTGKSARLDLRGVTTLGELKALVSATLKEGFPPEAQRLIVLGRQLDGDDRTLTELNVPAGATVFLVLRIVPPAPAAGAPSTGAKGTTAEINVEIKTLTGKTIKITTRTADTVEELKEDIRRSEGIPADQQRLIFAGCQMEDGETLARYNICQGSVISLVLRLRGGMMHESSGRDDHKPAARPAPAAIVRGSLFVGGSSEDESDDADAAGSSGAGAGSAAVATPASRVAAFEAAFDAGSVTLEELYALAEAAEEESGSAGGSRV
jgi:ubiquitin C